MLFAAGALSMLLFLIGAVVLLAGGLIERPVERTDDGPYLE